MPRCFATPHGSAFELVFGLVFKTCGVLPREGLGGFDSHAFPPFDLLMGIRTP